MSFTSFVSLSQRCVELGELVFGRSAFWADGLPRRSAWSAPTARFALRMRSWTFEIVELARGVFDGGGRGVLAEREAGASGIENADGLVGQLAAGE